MARVAELVRRSQLAAVLALAVAATSITLTLDRYGVSANGMAWSVVQGVLAFVAWFDLLERRILNAITGPTAVLAVVARVAFERQALAEIVLAGAAAFVAFLTAALLARAGLGMGDVKLAGVIGLLLGRTAGAALTGGVIIGGVVAAAILLRTRSRTSAFAYGPCLAAGAALGILLGSPPPLV